MKFDLRELAIKGTFQGHRILSEEYGVHNWDKLNFDGPVWVVDSLDGTVNFARNLPPSLLDKADYLIQ